MSKSKATNRKSGAAVRSSELVSRRTWINGPDMMPKPVNKALREWRTLTAPMEKIGFILHAFDPSVQFRCPDSNRVFDMSISAVRRINAALAANE